MIPRLALLLILAQAAHGDFIELKSGEKIEGRVVKTTPTEVTIEVQFSPTIVDERIVAREDIALLGVAEEDEVAFAKIREAGTPDTALTPKVCEAVINDSLAPFLKAFPTSDRAPDVQARIGAIRADIRRLQSGEVKVSGRWYDKSAFAVEKYQIEAATVFEAMSQQAAAGHVVEAMNSFNLLQTSYPASIAYADSYPLALKTTQKLLQQLAYAIAELPEVKARRQAAIDRTPPEQRQPVIQAIAAEDAQAAAAAKLAATHKQAFFPILPYDDKGLQAMLISARAIEKKLAALDAKLLAGHAKLVRRAQKELDEREFAGAESTLAELERVWPKYEALSRLKQRLADATTANKASAEAAAKNPPAPSRN